MGSLTNYAEDELMDHLFNAAYTPAATVYLALCTGDPGEAATGASCSEVSDANNYARTAISFGDAASRRITQDAVCTFPQASGTWGTITHWCIVDSGTHGAGNVLAYGEFSASFAPVSGNAPSIASGQVYIEIGATAGGAGLTDYAVNNLLDLMFDNTAFTSPQGNTFITLLNAAADDQDVSTTDLTEVSGTDYARKEVNPNGGSSPTWDLSSGGNVDNTHDVTFATVGSGGWSQIVGMAIVDALSGTANVLAYDNANVVDQTPAAGDTVKFTAGALDITLS